MGSSNGRRRQQASRRTARFREWFRSIIVVSFRLKFILLFILFAFLFHLVLASVLVSIFQCDAAERFGPKYLVAGCLGCTRSTGAFSQIRIPAARGRWARVQGRGCGSAPAGLADPAI